MRYRFRSLGWFYAHSLPLGRCADGGFACSNVSSGERIVSRGFQSGTVGADASALQVTGKAVVKVNGAELTDRDLLREMFALFPTRNCMAASRRRKRKRSGKARCR